MKNQYAAYKIALILTACGGMLVAGLIMERPQKRVTAPVTKPVVQPTNQVSMTFVDPVGESEASRIEWLSACSFYKLYLQSADSVLAKAGDEETRKIFKFVLDNAAIGKFDPSYGVDLMQQKEVTSNTFALIFSTPLDEEMLNRINPNLAGRAGSYIPKMRTMVIRIHHRLSATSRALIFIHEGSHAMRCLVDGASIDQNPIEQGNEELRVFAIERRMLFALGGNSYSNLVALEKKRISDLISSAGEKIGDVFVTHGPYDMEMEKIFGEAGSQEEKNYRSGLVNVVATLDLLDETFANDPKKLLALRRAYMTSLESPDTREFVGQAPKRP